MYPMYVSAGQINAIVPSNTPPGSASITVTYNGLTGQSPLIQITAAGFGIFTGSFGSGAAAAIDANTSNPYVSETNPAHPGDYILLFGTGLGPVNLPDNQAPGEAISPSGFNVVVSLGGAPRKFQTRRSAASTSFLPPPVSANPTNAAAGRPSPTISMPT